MAATDDRAVGPDKFLHFLREAAYLPPGDDTNLQTLAYLFKKSNTAK